MKTTPSPGHQQRLPAGHTRTQYTYVPWGSRNPVVNRRKSKQQRVWALATAPVILTECDCTWRHTPPASSCRSSDLFSISRHGSQQLHSTKMPWSETTTARPQQIKHVEIKHATSPDVLRKGFAAPSLPRQCKGLLFHWEESGSGMHS